MVTHSAGSAEEFFAGHPFARSVFDRVAAIVEAQGRCEVRVSQSQVALRRERGFAYLWLPGQYLRNPGSDAVLSIALGREVDSPRFKEVVHPSPGQWMHHLEIHYLDDLDDEVVGWLGEAADRAG